MSTVRHSSRRLTPGGSVADGHARSAMTSRPAAGPLQPLERRCPRSVLSCYAFGQEYLEQ